MKKLGAKTLFIQSDIADLASHDTTVEAVIEKFGRIDCLVNNAGIGSKVRGDFLDLKPANYNAIFEINLRGTVFFTQAVLKSDARRKSTHPHRARSSTSRRFPPG